MYSEEALDRVERAEALEREREEVGLSLRDTRSRVKKYDRLKKKNITKVNQKAFFVAFVNTILCVGTSVERQR